MEEFYYLCSENNCTVVISCAVTAQLICACVFTYKQNTGFLMTWLILMTRLISCQESHFIVIQHQHIETLYLLDRYNPGPS